MRVRGRRLIALAVFVAAFATLAGAAAWLVAHLVFDLGGEQVALAVAIVSSAAAVPAGVFGQPLFTAGLSRLIEERRPPGPTLEELERWEALLRAAVLRRRVLGARSQREQMLRRGVLLELPVSPDLGLHAGREGRPHVRLDGAGAPWTGLLEHWPAAEGRLVVIGDPGYGKTFAALALIEHINRGDDVVAELFPLAEWHAWSAGRDEPAIEDWLVDQLIQGYPELTPAVAWALLSAGKLVPVFDGLDEVPERLRADCRDALEAYAGRSEPFRPFVVTCRQAEYFALAPRWVGADRHVGLVGLDRDQIASVLRARFGRSESWAGVIEAVECGESQVLALLRSPLRLVAAIEAYESRDPRELLDLASRPDAGEELWNLLLSAGPRGFDGASDQDVRRWLGFVAASLQSHARQRFWLHELYLYAAPRDRRRFYLLTGGLFWGVACVPPVMTGSAFGITLAAAILTIFFVLYRQNRDKPVELAVRGNPKPMHYLRVLPRALYFWLFMTLVVTALAFPALFVSFLVAEALGEEMAPLGPATVAMLEIAAFCGVFSGAGGLVLVMANVGSSFVAEEPPSHLAGRGPGAVISAALRHGLIAAGIAVVAIGVPVALLTWHPLAILLAIAVSASITGWLGGLNAWAFHQWTRWRLARAGLLPRRLGRFLEWASEDVGYLRASDAYEFRHRELLDYLARGVEPVGEGNLSWGELHAERRIRWAETEARRADRLMDRHDYEGARAAYLAAAKAVPDDVAFQRIIDELLEDARKEASQW